MDYLVNQAKYGDEKALLELIDKLRPIRLSLIRKYPRLNSEDLNQDLVIVLIKCLDSYDPSKSSFAWYVRCQSNYHCLDKLKEDEFLSLDEEIADGLTLSDSLAANDNVEDDFLELVDSSYLRSAIERLDLWERKIILMYYYKNLSLSEIADYVGYSASHISRIKARGIKYLKKILRKDDIYDY